MAVSKTDESLAERKRRTRRILSSLRKTYGDVDCALHHSNALELLIATILSAQSTDVNVNKVTPDLFRTYRSAADFAVADREALEQAVHSTGFFRQKAKSIQGACRLIEEQHAGEVPARMDQLVELPGVARKTANVVLGTWYGRNEGIVVDTHVGRLSERLGLTWSSKDAKDAVKIESDLMQVVPKASWTYFSHALIHHGRQVCTARKARCSECSLLRNCPSAKLE
ncbi:MAG: endonuclease III [bacterium]|nr:endonuclease III [bacterium]